MFKLQPKVVQGQLLQVAKASKSLDECDTVRQGQVVVSELDLIDANVGLNALSEEADSAIRHLIVAHVEHLQVPGLQHVLLDWLDL